MERLIAFLALIVSVAAVCIVGIGEDPAPPESAADALALQRLGQRIGDLERAVAQLDAGPHDDVALVGGSAPARTSGDSERIETAALDAIVQRLENVESALARPVDVRSTSPGIEAALRRVQEDVPTLRSTATDVTLTDEERLQALRQLRFATDEAGVNGRSPAVVSAMIDVVQTSTDAGTRADVFRQLDGVTDLTLRPVLLDALAHDSHAKVREEAAETLGEYLPDALVEDALRYAAANDPDEDVRQEATRSLH